MSLEPQKPPQITPGLLTEMGQALLAEIKKSFAGQKAPDGTSWEPNLDGHTPINVRTGKMRDSIEVEATTTSLRVYSAVAYALCPNAKNRFIPNDLEAMAELTKALAKRGLL